MLCEPKLAECPMLPSLYMLAGGVAVGGLGCVHGGRVRV